MKRILLFVLTNLAVVKDWPLGLTFIDMAWGTMVSGVAAMVGKLALDYLNKSLP